MDRKNRKPKKYPLKRLPLLLSVCLLAASVPSDMWAQEKAAEQRFTLMKQAETDRKADRKTDTEAAAEADAPRAAQRGDASASVFGAEENTENQEADFGAGETEDPEAEGPAGPENPGTEGQGNFEAEGPAGPGNSGTEGQGNSEAEGPAGPGNPGTEGQGNSEAEGPAGPGNSGTEGQGNSEAEGPAGPGNPGTEGQGNSEAEGPAGPGNSGTEEPENPGTESPESPENSGAEEQENPGAEGPAGPGNPGTEGQENPGAEGPAGPGNPGTEGQENPGTEGPESPSTGSPENPENPGTEEPENPGTETPEEAGFGETAFSGEVEEIASLASQMLAAASNLRGLSGTVGIDYEQRGSKEIRILKDCTLSAEAGTLYGDYTFYVSSGARFDVQASVKKVVVEGSGSVYLDVNADYVFFIEEISATASGYVHLKGSNKGAVSTMNIGGNSSLYLEKGSERIVTLNLNTTGAQAGYAMHNLATVETCNLENGEISRAGTIQNLNMSGGSMTVKAGDYIGGSVRLSGHAYMKIENHATVALSKPLEISGNAELDNYTELMGTFHVNVREDGRFINRGNVSEVYAYGGTVDLGAGAYDGFVVELYVGDGATLVSTVSPRSVDNWYICKGAACTGDGVYKSFVEAVLVGCSAAPNLGSHGARKEGKVFVEGGYGLYVVTEEDRSRYNFSIDPEPSGGTKWTDSADGEVRITAPRYPFTLTAELKPQPSVEYQITIPDHVPFENGAKGSMKIGCSFKGTGTVEVRVRSENNFLLKNSTDNTKSISYQLKKRLTTTALKNDGIAASFTASGDQTENRTQTLELFPVSPSGYCPAGTYTDTLTFYVSIL